MAFFCTQTGARIVAPGVSLDANKTEGVPVHDGSKAALLAESAAVEALSRGRRSEVEGEPNVSAQDEARAAAKRAHAEASRDEPTKPDAAPKGGRRAPTDKND